MPIWTQPLNPLDSMALSALVAAVPLALLLFLMGGLRKASAVAAAWGLAAALLLAVVVWHMPAKLACLSLAYGAVYGLWPIMGIVFAALWLYNLAADTGNFDLLRRWMAEHAFGDARLQVILVAFCFGALLEGLAGFGAPVAFGGLGIPIVALAGVTGLDQMKLSAMVGRQLPFLSLILPGYLVWVVAGRRGLKETWPAALVAGASFAAAQFAVSNFWGPYAADIIAALTSITALTLFCMVWKPVAARAGSSGPSSGDAHAPLALSRAEVLAAWTPWVLLSAVMIVWSYLKLFQRGQLALPVPGLHNAIFIALYQKPYAAIFAFQPLAAGTAALTASVITALLLGADPATFLRSGLKTFRQLRQPGLTVALIVALAYLYNYSGMAFTLGAALAGLGVLFPLASGFLGWIACFLSGSDTASNLLFGNLQVAAAHQIGVNPVLLAATNSSGAVTGKMISPQNIAVGVTTVGLVGKEGHVMRTTLAHSLLLATLLSALAFAQAYWLKWMVP